jgi:hypothetical protein
LVTIVLPAGDQIPTVKNSVGSTTVFETPPVTVTATILADSRVQLYNVTQAIELDNSFITGTSYSYIVS